MVICNKTPQERPFFLISSQPQSSIKRLLSWLRVNYRANMVANMISNGLLLVQLFAALALGKPSSTPLYKDASAPVEKRVKDLLGRMTIEDKMGQLIQGTFDPMT